MAKINSVVLEDVFTLEAFEKLAKELAKLPTPEEFCKKAEGDIWEVVAGTPAETITYEKMAERSRNLFGVITPTDGKGEATLPWWLESFEWKARQKGGTQSYKLDAQTLVNWQKDFPADCDLLRPSLKILVNTLDRFQNLLKNLVDQLKLQSAQKEPKPAVPKLFEWSEKGLRTTEAFKQWFDHLVALVPPCQPQLTALLLLNSNVQTPIAGLFLSGGVMDVLAKLGLISGSRMSNYYVTNYVVTLLDLTGAFDIALARPQGFEEFTSLTPLQVYLYQAAVNILSARGPESISAMKMWITKMRNYYSIKDEDEREYFRVAPLFPFYRDSSYLCARYMDPYTRGAENFLAKLGLYEEEKKK